MPHQADIKIKNGFTLIEILVAITIITLMSVFFIPSYRKGAQQMALQRSASKLYQDFRRVQEMAISSRICTECLNNPASPPLRGYGIALTKLESEPLFPIANNKTYIIYAHNDTSNYYFFNPYSDPPDVMVESISLEKGVIIKDIIDLENGNSYVHFGVNFIPPEPTLGMECDVCGHQIIKTARIILSLEDNPTLTKTIYINAAGLIYGE